MVILAVASWMGVERRLFYAEASGDYYDTYYFYVDGLGIHLLDPSFEARWLFESAYPSHFMGIFLGCRATKDLLGGANLPLWLAAGLGWELAEAYVLKTEPVSIGDLASDFLGALWAEMEPSGIRPVLRWAPMMAYAPNEKTERGLAEGWTTLYGALFYTAPGNYNPYTFGFVKTLGRCRVELGVRHNPKATQTAPWRWPGGWGALRLDSRGAGVEPEPLLGPGEHSPSSGNPYIRVYWELP